MNCIVATTPIWDWVSELNWYRELVARLFYSLICGNASNVKDYLKFQDIDASAMNGIWDYFEGVGICLIVIFFLVDFSKTMLEQRGDFQLISVFAPFIKLIAGLMVIANGKDIISGFLGINNSIVDAIDGKSIYDLSSGGDPIGAVGEVLRPILEEIKLLPAILTALFGFVVWILSQLCYLVIIYQAISRKIEMILRGGLMPLAIGDIYRGLESNGIRYLKKFLALCIWGFAMMAVIQIGNSMALANLAKIFKNIVDTSIFGLLGAVVTSIVYPLAEAGMVSACKVVCTDALGC